MNPSRTAALSCALLFLLVPEARAQFVLARGTDLAGIDDAAFTPDGTRVVLRDNRASTRALVLDASSGRVLLDETLSGLVPGGVCQDAVAVTDQRAVVIGTATLILDLTTSTVLAEHSTGYRARDVAISPDGSLAAVRGGSTSGLGAGGLFLFDLATGAQVAYAPGEPPTAIPLDSSGGSDSVAIDDRHAVFTSVEAGPAGQGARTVVTVFELRPTGGGAPRVVYSSQGAERIAGTPHDLAITPDGRFAAVRSDHMVALYRLDGPATARSWARRLWDDPGPIGESAVDSLELTDERLVTIGRRQSGASFGGQLDLFTLDGENRHRVLFGDPHDLAITPDGTRALVRTSEDVYLFDIQDLPPGDVLTELSSQDHVSTHTGYGAGLDSLVCTDERAVTLARVDDRTRIRFWDLRQDFLVQFASFTMMDIPSDVELTSDGTRVLVTGLTRSMAFLLESGQPIFEDDPAAGGGFAWCDGVAVAEDRALYFGYVSNAPAGGGSTEGWYSLVDLFRDPLAYCGAVANSSGEVARLEPFGSASVQANDLAIQVLGLPPGATGSFVLGDGQSALPFGGGTLCVGGTLALLGLQAADPAGNALLELDLTSTPVGAILPGSTWNLQFLFDDPAAGERQTSDAYQISFSA